MNCTPLPFTVCARTSVGLPVSRGTLPQHAREGLVVVAVDLARPTSERTRHLSANGLEVEHLRHRAEALDLVVVDDRRPGCRACGAGRTAPPPRSSPRRIRRRESSANTRPGLPSSLTPSAMPAASDSPWPSEPVENSTPGTPCDDVAREAASRPGSRWRATRAGRSRARPARRRARPRRGPCSGRSGRARASRDASGPREGPPIEHREDVGHREAGTDVGGVGGVHHPQRILADVARQCARGFRLHSFCTSRRSCGCLRRAAWRVSSRSPRRGA